MLSRRRELSVVAHRLRSFLLDPQGMCASHTGDVQQAHILVEPRFAHQNR
jgi:hypothetical protein